MEITRRSFLKLGAILGIGSALPGCAKELVLKPKEEPLAPKGDEKFVSTICAMCEAGCGLRVRKIGESAVGLSGDPDHPINQGGLCPKGAAALQELYHPDRIRGPLIRQGDRGRGGWQEVSWEKALSLAAGMIKKAGSEKRSKPFGAITASQAQDINRELLRDLVHQVKGGGVSVLGFPIGDPPLDAYQNMHGNKNVFLDLTKPRLLVSFSFDWLSAHPSSVEAQRAYAELRQGFNRPRAHIVAIEPRFSVTASRADEWIAIKPGTEGVLALALARQLIQNGTFDKNFVARHTQGFEEFKKYLDVFSLETASRVTGAAQEKIRLLAVKFFSLKPAAAISSRGSAFNQMAVHVLNVLLGSIGPGQPFLTGQSLSFSLEGRGQGEGENGLRGERGFGETPGVLLVDRANPLFLDPVKWRPIFEKAPFVMTVSSHLTETAQFSDLILPSHAPLEARHLSRHVSMEGRPIVNAAGGAVRPLYDTKDAGEIYLALKLALAGKKIEADAFSAYVKKRTQELGAQKLLKEGTAETWLYEAKTVGQNLVFSTPSGKFELGPLVKSLRGRRLDEPPTSQDFPLLLNLFSPLAFSRGEGAHLPYLLDIAGPGLQEMWGAWAELHPDTAQAYGISDGQMIWVESPQGKIKAKARVLARAMPSVVSVPVGLGHTAYGRWAKGTGSNPLEIASMDGVSRVRVVRA